MKNVRANDTIIKLFYSVIINVLISVNTTIKTEDEKVMFV